MTRVGFELPGNARIARCASERRIGKIWLIFRSKFVVSVYWVIIPKIKIR